MRFSDKIRLALFTIMTLSAVIGYSQVGIVGINDDGSAPDASAALDIKSSNKGLLIPRVALTSTTSNAPVGSGIATSLMVYNTATVNDVTPGYYYWNGSSWVQLNAPVTGSQYLNVVLKTSSGPIAKTETMVIASGDITLTLPAVTGADNGLQITVVNAGTYKDLAVLKGAAPGVTIHTLDSVIFYRGNSKTFVAVDGNWAKKDHTTMQDNVFDISEKSSWNTVAEAIAFLKEHMTGPSLIRLGGRTYEIDTTLTVDLPYPLTIEGVSYGEATIQGTAGLSGHEMFDCITECYLKMLNISAYDNSAGSDAIHFSGSGEYYEVKDCYFNGFNKGLLMASNNETWIFESDFEDISNCGIELADQSGSSTGPVLKISEVDFTNCGKGIDLVKGKNGTVSAQNCTFYNGSAGQTGILYTPGTGNFETFSTILITNCSWNNAGNFMSGFDFTRSDGRDANAFIMNNPGMENKNPHVKINVINNSSATSCPSNGYYYKASFTNTSSYTCKWTVADNKITYQPLNKCDVVMTLTGNIMCNNSGRNLTVGVVKNGTYGPYGTITVRGIQANSYISFSTVIYLEDVAKEDYFEIYVNSSGNNDLVTFSDINWYADGK